MASSKTSGTTRPPTLPVQQVPADDPNALAIKKLEAWAADTVAPYVIYTPELTGTSGAFALGAGAYLLGRWKRAGCRCNVEILIYLGAGGFAPGGNTIWHISLPILPILSSTPAEWLTKNLGTCYLQNGVTQFFYPCLASKVGPGGPVNRDFTIGTVGFGVGQMVTGTIPGMVTPTTMQINLSYESAP